VKKIYYTKYNTRYMYPQQKNNKRACLTVKNKKITTIDVFFNFCTEMTFKIHFSRKNSFKVKKHQRKV